jgi:hypothetical protein
MPLLRPLKVLVILVVLVVLSASKGEIPRPWLSNPDNRWCKGDRLFGSAKMWHVDWYNHTVLPLG